MNKKINICIIAILILSSSFASAQTKPAPGTDPNSVSYIFYLYYSDGQLFGDRDYAVNYDVIPESYVPEQVGATSYRGEIVNSKSEVVRTFQFDPRKGDVNFKMGKVSVKGPYAPDGFRANFYDSTSKPILAIFVSNSAICDGDGFCNAQLGEDSKTCPVDCPTVRTSPLASNTPLPSAGGESTFFGLEPIQILIYVFSGIGVGVVAWLVWKWWKKKKEGDFPLPPPSSIVPPPPPPVPLG